MPITKADRAIAALGLLSYPVVTDVTKGDSQVYATVPGLPRTASEAPTLGLALDGVNYRFSLYLNFMMEIGREIPRSTYPKTTEYRITLTPADSWRVQLHNAIVQKFGTYDKIPNLGNQNCPNFWRQFTHLTDRPTVSAQGLDDLLTFHRGFAMAGMDMAITMHPSDD